MRPVILLAAANDRSPTGAYLTSLATELRGIRETLEAGHRAGQWEVDPRPNITIPELLSLLRDQAFAARVALLHYAGHGSPDALLLESDDAAGELAHAGGLAALLGMMPRLRLVFLNGCETRGQVPALLAAGVSAVIATDVRIADAIATQFSLEIYRALVARRTLGEAVKLAERAACMRAGHARSAYRDIVLDHDDVAIEWPWRLYPAAPHVERWTLADLLGTNVTAAAARARLPAQPYRHLLPFTRADAAVFFGRTRDLRQLLDVIIDPHGAPLVLLFGAAGTGKSSLLDAGLAAQLADRATVRYARRDAQLGLGGTLRTLLGVDVTVDRAQLEHAWTALESADRPVVLLLDQIEEAITRAVADPRAELNSFAADLAALLAEREPGSPERRVVLGFRKEWLAEVQSALRGHSTISHFLDRLDEAAVIEAVRGPADDPRLARQYQLEIEDGLAESIARDMLADPHAPVAPTLQVLLARMWDAAPPRDGVRRRFDRELYDRLRREGLLLGDFLDQQLTALARTHAAAVASGLALDVLHAHTTAHGTTENLTADELTARYPNARDALPSLVQQLTDLVLLTTSSRTGIDVADELAQPSTRLVHDTLAPLVRERFDRSDRPAQRARRLLELRARDWRERGTPISLDDLAIIEAGLGAMRALDADEQRMVEAGRNSRRIANIARRAGNLTDPLRAAELLVTLRGEPEPPGGAALAAAIAAQSLPIFESERYVDPPAVLTPDGSRVLYKRGRELRSYAIDGASEPRVVWRADDGSRTAQIEFTTDRTRAIISSDQGPVMVISLDGGSEPVTLRVDSDVVGWAVPDSTGRRVAAVTGPFVFVWDLDRPDEPRTLKHDYPIERLAFSPDGEWVLTVTESVYASANTPDREAPDYRLVHLWRVSTLQVTQRFTESTVTFAAFAPDSSSFLIMSDRCRVSPCEGDGEIIDLDTPEGMYTAAFSRAGDRVAITSGGYDVMIHDLSGKRPPVRFQNPALVRSIVFSPDGAQIAAVMDIGVHVWPSVGSDAGSTAPARRVFTHVGARTVEFSADGKLVLTVGQGSHELVRVWRNELPREPVRGHCAVGGDIPAPMVAFSPDETRFLMTDRSAVRVLAVTDAAVETVLQTNHHENWADFASDDHVLVYNPVDGLQLHPLDGSAPVRLASGETLFWPRVDPLSRRILACDRDTVLLWPVRGAGEPIRFRHSAPVRSAEFSNGERIIVTTETDIVIWPADAGSPGTFSYAAREARLSADGSRLLTISSDGDANVWHMGRPAEPLPLPHGEYVVDADFNPDGNFVVTAAGRAAHVWATDGRGEIFLLEHDAEVLTVRYSRDGRRIMVAPPIAWGTSSVCIWPADGKGDPVRLNHSQGITSASFSVEATRVVTGCADGSAAVWRVDWELLLEFLEDELRKMVRA